MTINTLDFNKLNATVWQDARQIDDLTEKLKTASKIITRDGCFDRIQWPSESHRLFSVSFQHPQKANILATAFEEVFKDWEDGYDKQRLRDFIVHNHMLIGINKVEFNFSPTAISYMADEGFRSKFAEFQERVSQDLQRVCKPFKTAKSTDRLAVAIITFRAGGGHLLAAQSVERALNAHESHKYNAKVIDLHRLKHDRLEIVSSGIIKTEDLYSKFRCQENNPAKADALGRFGKALDAFMLDQTAQDADEIIRDLKADVVINTIHHEHEWAFPLSNGIPFATLIVDYYRNISMMCLRSTTDSSDLRFFSPLDYSSKVLRPVGYPIRPGFEKRASDRDIAAVRRKYEVKDNELLVVFQMGALALGLEEEIAYLKGAAQKLKKKCHFVFLCSQNEKAKKTIEKAACENKNSLLALHVEGFLEDTELSHLFQASDTVVGKAGGSTSAEIAATGAYLLAYKSLRWEKPNIAYLAGRNQARVISGYSDMVSFLNDRKPLEPKIATPVLDWKTNLCREIDDMVLTAGKTPLVIKWPYSSWNPVFYFIAYCRHIWNAIKAVFQKIAYVFSKKPPLLVKA